MNKSLFFFFLLTALLSTSAFAKKISIQWQVLPGAIRYDLFIESDEGKVLKQAVAVPQWSGNLSEGAYVYRIRAIDRIKRPGVWSSPSALVVMPAPPEPESPASEEVIHSYKRKEKVKVKWKEVKGASQYRLEVKQSKQMILNAQFKKNEADIPQLAIGEYQWQVWALIEAPERFPDSLKNKKWESASSTVRKFSIEKKDLEAPSLVSPKGALWMPKNGTLSLQWEKVQGAESYSVSIASQRTPADVKQYKTEKDAMVIALPQEGPYQWQVSALAGDSAGPQSVADFKLERDLDIRSEKTGYFALSTMLAPYQYEHESPIVNQKVETESKAVTGRLSGEYWYWKHMALAGGVDNTVFVINQRSFNRFTYEVGVKFNMKLSQDRYGWFFAPKVGAEARDYFSLLLQDQNNPNSLLSTRITVLGLAAGFDLRRQLSARWSLGVKAAYFLPVSISAPSFSPQISSNSSYGNLNLGAQGLYWLSRSWGLGMGLFLDQRSIGYTVAGAVNTNAETIVMDGVYFFGSLVYTFGHD
jgi:hypothetical protein